MLVAFARVGARGRAGIARALAVFLSDARPDVAAISGISAGDALSLSTRFALQYAYRGGQTLLWNDVFAAARVQDVYLPIAPAQPLQRRGLLRVDGRSGGRALTLYATEFASDRSRIRDRRFLRTALRERAGDAIAFVANPGPGGAGVRDLGFARAALEKVDADVAICVRGFALEVVACSLGDGARPATALVRATA